MKFKLYGAFFLFIGLSKISFSQVSGDIPNVSYVSLDIESKKNISCRDFDSAFSKKDYKIWYPETDEVADSLAVYFKQFVRIRNQDVNIRAKIEYYIRGNSILIYMSNFGIFTDDYYYFKNENLFRFLQRKFKD